MNYLFIFILVTVAGALPNPDSTNKNRTTFFVEEARLMENKCSKDIFNLICWKLKAVSIIEKLNSEDDLEILPGISVVRETSQNDSIAKTIASEFARVLPGPADKSLDKYLLNQFGNYIDSHTVDFKFLNDNAIEEDTNITFEGRGRKKIMKAGHHRHHRPKQNYKGLYAIGIGVMVSVLAGAAMVKGAMVSMGLVALALIIGKAMVSAFIAIVVAAVIGLKALFYNHGKTTTTRYEIAPKIYSHPHVPEPHYEYHQPHEDLSYAPPPSYGI